VVAGFLFICNGLQLFCVATYC